MLIRMVLREDGWWRAYDGLLPREGSFKDSKLEDMPEILRRAIYVALARNEVDRKFEVRKGMFVELPRHEWWNTEYSANPGWVEATKTVDIDTFHMNEEDVEVARWMGKRKLAFS